MKNQLINNFRDFVETFFLLKKRPLLFLLTLIIDFVFVFIFLTLSRLFIDPIFLHISKIHHEVIYELNIEIVSSMNQILFLSLIYILVIFIIFILFQNFNWFISNKIVGNKIKFFDFVSKFFLISLFYFILITIVLYFPLRIAVNSLFENQFILENITVILIPLILIFMLINLCTLSFKTTYKKIHHFILPSTIIFALIVFIDLFTKLLFEIGIKGYFLLIITAILLFIVISYSRIFLINKVKKIN